MAAGICFILPAAAQNARVVVKKPTSPGVQEAVFLLGLKDSYTLSGMKGDASLGMPGPVATGWYCYGFFNFTVNGQEAKALDPTSMIEAEQGQRAIMDAVWRLDAAQVRVRTLGLPGRDFLFCEMTVEPLQEIKSIEMTMICYPAKFTGFYGQREQARFVQTPSRLVREADPRTNVAMTPQEDWWLLYGDEFFDVAKTRESEGPCAMLILPEDISGITVRSVGYDVTTAVSVAPTTRRIRMAFWKMKDRTNVAAADYFRSNGEAIRKELAALDFTPGPVTSFDLAGMTAQIEAIGTSTAVGAEFQKKAADLLASIKAGAAELTAPGDGISATEAKLKLQGAYSSFIAEARLAEILASLDKD